MGKRWDTVPLPNGRSLEVVVQGDDFDLSAITAPVSVWQGRQDRMVPIAHGG